MTATLQPTPFSADSKSGSREAGRAEEQDDVLLLARIERLEADVSNLCETIQRIEENTARLIKLLEDVPSP